MDDFEFNEENSLRISDKKILIIRNVSDIEVSNEEVQIFYFTSTYESEIREILINLNLKNFPNVFAFVFTNFQLDVDRPYVYDLFKKFESNREYFIHSKCRDDYKSFFNKTDSGLIKMHESEGFTKMKAINIKTSRKLETCKDFFILLNYQKVLLNKVDFWKILKFLGFTAENNKLLYLERAIEAQNVQLVKLLTLFVNKYYEKIFKLALETENDKIIDAIWINFKDFAIDFKIWCQMREILETQNNGDFFEKVQKCETNFYEVSNDEQPPKKLKVESKVEKIVLTSELAEFHQNIKEGDYEKVRNFIAKFPQFKFCFYESKSALEESIDSKKMEIYSLLANKGFICENKESLDKKVQKVPQQIEEEIKVLDNLFNILTSKCKFFSSTNNLEVKNTRQFLKSVCKIEGAQEMMKILAQSNVTVFLDVDNKIVRAMYGLTLCDTKNIHTGFEKEATFVHEMTHYVCSLIYENECLPYCEHDRTREAEFDEIFKEIEENYSSKNEEIVAKIFECYKTKISQKVELIARVPDMLAMYRNQSSRLNKLEAEFKNLFTFYRKRFLHDIGSQNLYRMIKLNNDFELLKSIDESKFQVKAKNGLNLTQNRILFISKTPQLALSRIVQELKKKSIENNSAINFKAKNIFVDLKKLKFNLEELQNLIENSSIERVIANIQNISVLEHNLEFFENLNDKIQYILVVDENDTKSIEKLSNFERQNLNFEWQELSEETKIFVLNRKVNFQRVEIKIGELFDEPEKSINSDVLAVLSGNSEIPINWDLSVENWENFVERTILKKQNSEREFIELSTIDFILETRRIESFQNIVLISDPVGSGKTFLFKKLCDDLKNAEFEIQKQECRIQTHVEQNFDKKKLIFPLFLSLSSHIDKLKEFEFESSDNAEEVFVDFVTKMTDFDGLTKAVFAQKFSKGQTMIFFDGFDEILPICKENTMKLFRLFQKTLPNVAQRKKVDSNEMEVDHQVNRNQIFISSRIYLEAEFERKFNTSCYKLRPPSQQEQIKYLCYCWKNENPNLTFVRNCAEKLVHKVSKALPNIDLHPEIYDPAKEPKVGLFIILSGLVQTYLDRINESFDEDIQYITLFVIFDKFILEKHLKVFQDQFGRNNYSCSLKTISPMQIHQFFAFKMLVNEELAWSQGIYHSKRDWPLEEVARFGMITYQDKNVNFIHSSFAEFFIAQQMFNMLKTVKNYTNDQMTILMNIFNEEFALSRLILDSMLERVENCEEKIKVFQSNGDICEIFSQLKYLVDISADEGLFCVFDFLMSLAFKFHIETFRKLVFRRQKRGNFLEIFIYAKNVEKAGKLLDKIFEAGIPFDDMMDGILPLMIKYSQNYQLFGVFWSKCENFIANEHKLKQIFTKKDKNGQNLLQIALELQENEEIFKIIFSLTINKIFNGNLEELEEFLFGRDQNILFDIKSEKHFKFVFEKIGQIFGDEKCRQILRMKNKFGRNLLTSTISMTSNELLWIIFEKYFSREEIHEILQEKDQMGLTFIHNLAIDLNSIDNLNFYAEKIQQMFFQENLHQFLLDENENGENALMLAVDNSKMFPLIFEKIFCANFPRVENFIYKSDKNSENFFHKIIKSGEISQLKLAFNRLMMELNTEKLENYFSVKNKHGENIFHLSAKSNEEKIEFLIEISSNHFGDRKLREMLSEKDENNCFPLHTTLIDQNIENFQLFFAIYEQHFSKNKIQEFLKLKKINFYEKLLEEIQEKPGNKKFVENLKIILANFKINF